MNLAHRTYFKYSLRTFSGAIAVILLALIAWQPAAAAERRVALVIGNGAYQHANKLTNPTKDGRAITKALLAIGFEVVDGYDLTTRAMLDAVARFERLIEGAEVALVYYSGHGIAVDGVNYLIPVDATIDSRAALQRDAVSAEWLLGQVMEREDRISILMLDACRNNPFTRSFTASTRSAVASGLAEVRAMTGSYVAFAAAPGKVAWDGNEDAGNSPFTAAVLQHLGTPGLEIESMMKKVRQEVWERTSKEQMPWGNSALLGEFYFVPAEVDVPAPAPAPAPATMAALTTVDDQPARPIKDPAPTETQLSPAAAESALGLGRADWQELQRAMTALGFNTHGLDGRPDAATRNAITAWQTSTGQAATGYLVASQRAQIVREAAVKLSTLTAPAGVRPGALVTDCDRLASHPGDSGRAAVAGLEFPMIDPQRAVPACQDAVSRWPEGQRFAFQYGRALQRQGNDGEAMRWYRKAADRGYAGAQANLGVMYEDGKGGLAKDEAEAVRWYRKAADQGSSSGKQRLAALRLNSPDPRDEVQVLRDARRAADTGDAKAQYMLGPLYVDGSGVPADSTEAARWFRKAADQGDVDAQYYLGVLYARGQGVRKNEATAAEWFRKAARQGDTNAQDYLDLLNGVASNAPRPNDIRQPGKK